MTRDTCCTSMPRDHTSVVISTRLEKRERERGKGGKRQGEGRSSQLKPAAVAHLSPPLNSFMMASLSF